MAAAFLIGSTINITETDVGGTEGSVEEAAKFIAQIAEATILAGRRTGLSRRGITDRVWIGALVAFKRWKALVESRRAATGAIVGAFLSPGNTTIVDATEGVIFVLGDLVGDALSLRLPPIVISIAAHAGLTGFAISVGLAVDGVTLADAIFQRHTLTEIGALSLAASLAIATIGIKGAGVVRCKGLAPLRPLQGNRKRAIDPRQAAYLVVEGARAVDMDVVAHKIEAK